MKDERRFSVYLPIVQGHIIKHYGRLAERGNCLITKDDLVQIAAIELLTLIDKWDDIVAERDDVEPGASSDRLFWAYLQNNVKSAALNYSERVAKTKQEARRSLDAPGLEDHDNSDAVRTSIQRYRDPSLVQQEIADFYDLMPTRDKTLVALRYFDELSFNQIAHLMDAQPVTARNLTYTAVERWKTHARNQWLDQIEKVPARIVSGWEAPEPLVGYMDARYRTDLHTYLGYVGICLRADVSYLCDILGKGRFQPTGASQSLRKLTVDDQMAIDLRLASGESQASIAKAFGVGQSTISDHNRRRVAA